MYNELCGIKTKNKAAECLGMYICHDKKEWYAKNWIKIYYNIKKLFESWGKKRKLTLFGNHA